MESALAWSPTPTPHDDDGMTPAMWDKVFASPLDPSIFALLAANGVLGPPTPGPAPEPMPTMAQSSSSLYEPYGGPAVAKPRVQQQSQQQTMRNDRPALGLPPSLWMTSAAPTTNYNVYPAPAALPSSSPSSSILIPRRSPQSPISPSASVVSNTNSLHSHRSGGSTSTSVTGKASGTVFTDLFNDDLLSTIGSTSTGLTSIHPQQYAPTGSPLLSPQATPFSPQMLHSPVGTSEASSDSAESIDQLVKEDPLAKQVWKMYAKQKAGLPNAQRMENLTWRMMALALKKKEREDKEKGEKEREKANTSSSEEKRPLKVEDPEPEQKKEEASKRTEEPEQQQRPQPPEQDIANERGRRIDKGKPRVRVVGFDGTNMNGSEALE